MQRVQVIWWNLQRFFSLRGSGLAHELGAGPDKGWNRTAYQAKLHNVASVLRAIAGPEGPALMALSEVEDHSVIQDIVSSTGWAHLAEAGQESHTLDGYDITLLYSRDLFELAEEPKSYNIHNRYQVRDIFEVPLRVQDGGQLLVIINHWPSRTWSQSDALRIGLADFCSRLFERRVKFTMEEMIQGDRCILPERALLESRWDLPVLILGDFNDEPFDPSIFQVLRCVRDAAPVRRKPRLPRSDTPTGVQRYVSLHPKLYNPCWKLLTPRRDTPPGTYFWNGRWYLLDQIMLSRGFLTTSAPRFVEGSLSIFAPQNVTGLDGGSVELRTRSSRPFPFDPERGRGVSDHFPLVFEIDLPSA